MKFIGPRPGLSGVPNDELAWLAVDNQVLLTIEFPKHL